MLQVDINRKFFSTDIAAIGDEEYHETDSDVVSIAGAKTLAVICYGTCGSASLNEIDFIFAAKVNGVWTDNNNPFKTVSVTQAHSVTVVKAELIDVTGINAIKIVRVYNGATDGTNGDVSAVNAKFNLSRG